MRSEKYDFENISVNGKSKVTVKPDSAKIKFKIKKHDEILASAKDNVDSRSKLMIEKCLSLGVSRESQKSSNITVKPYREWSGGSGYTMKGYEVSREIEIAIQEIDKFNEVIQMLIDVPINEITEIKMESSSIDLYKKLATQEAVSDAKDKAKYLCDQFDIELGDVFQIDDVDEEDRIWIGGAATRGSVSESELSFEPENIEIKKQVSIVFKLKL